MAQMYENNQVFIQTWSLTTLVHTAVQVRINLTVQVHFHHALL